MRTKAPSDVPVYRTNIYTPDAIVDPYPHYTRTARAGPRGVAVRHRVYALPEYAECKAVLRDDKTFVSGRRCRTQPADQPAVPRHHAHQRRRRARSAPQAGRAPTAPPRAASHRRQRRRRWPPMSSTPHSSAARSTASTIWRPRCRMAVVPDLVGWPRDERDNLLRWGAATFDILGPLNKQAREVGSRLPADAAVRQPRGPRPQRHRGQHGPRAASRRGRGQAVPRRAARR